jgi:predicted Zn-dependent protease
VELGKKESYAIQIGLYLKNKQLLQARGLMDSMLEKFPNEPLSHFMAAKTRYFSGDYERAAKEGEEALAFSKIKDDRVASTIVTASALFMLRKYEEGHALLAPFEKEENEELKKLLIMFSMVMKEGKEAGEYYKELHELNRAAAENFIKKLAEGRRLE